MRTDDGEIIKRQIAETEDYDGADLGKIVEIRKKVNDILTMSIPLDKRADLIKERIEEIPLTEEEAFELGQVEKNLRLRHLLRKRASKI